MNFARRAKDQFLREQKSTDYDSVTSIAESVGGLGELAVLWNPCGSQLPGFVSSRTQVG